LIVYLLCNCMVYIRWLIKRSHLLCMIKGNNKTWPIMQITFIIHKLHWFKITNNYTECLSIEFAWLYIYDVRSLLCGRLRLGSLIFNMSDYYFIYSLNTWLLLNIQVFLGSHACIIKILPLIHAFWMKLCIKSHKTPIIHSKLLHK